MPVFAARRTPISGEKRRFHLERVLLTMHKIGIKGALVRRPLLWCEQRKCGNGDGQTARSIHDGDTGPRLCLFGDRLGHTLKDKEVERQHSEPLSQPPGALRMPVGGHPDAGQA